VVVESGILKGARPQPPLPTPRGGRAGGQRLGPPLHAARAAHRASAVGGALILASTSHPGMRPWPAPAACRLGARQRQACRGGTPCRRRPAAVASTRLPHGAQQCPPPFTLAAGFDLGSIKAAADKVVLRPNAAQVLRRARLQQVPVHVLSVNWSTEFVARVLGVDDQPTYRCGWPCWRWARHVTAPARIGLHALARCCWALRRARGCRPLALAPRSAQPSRACMLSQGAGCLHPLAQALSVAAGQGPAGVLPGPASPRTHSLASLSSVVHPSRTHTTQPPAARSTPAPTWTSSPSTPTSWSSTGRASARAASWAPSRAPPTRAWSSRTCCWRRPAARPGTLGRRATGAAAAATAPRGAA
jgi:hypothetical protein